MNVYAILYKAIKENMFDNIMAVYVKEGETLNFYGNVDLKSKDSIINFIAQYGNHDVVGIRMLGITISQEPLDYEPYHDRDMLFNLIG